MADEAASTRKGSARGRRQSAVLFLVLLTLALITQVLHVTTYTKVSPIDELQHIDYLYKITSGDLVRRGDVIGQDALREQACRGLDHPWELPACDSAYFDPSRFQESGINTASIHSPAYYFVTGVPARIGHLLPGIGSLVTAARLIGGLWLLTGLAFMWLAMGELQVSPWPRFVAALLIVPLPSVVHAVTTVNPDATGLVTGAALLWIMLRVERGAAPPWSLGLVAGAAVLLKATNIVAVAVAILYVSIRIYQRRWVAPSRRDVDTIGWTIAGTVAASAAWLAARALMTDLPPEADPQQVLFKVDVLLPSHFFESLGATFFAGSGYTPALLYGSMAAAMATLAGLILLGGIAAAVTDGEAGSRRSALGVAVVLTLLAAAPLFVLVNFILSGAYVSIPARYAMSALPAMGATLSLALHKRSLVFIFAAFAVVAWVRLLVALGVAL